MATLTGTKIQDTYDGLLKVSDNVGINSTKKIITDGLGNDSSVKISSQDFEVGGFFYIDIDGNVPNSKIGIGTSSPQQALHISGSIQVNGTYHDSSGEGGDYGEVLLALGSETNWTNRFVIGMVFSDYAQFVGYAEFQGGIKDYTGSFGTNGQVLMTTGSDVEWVSLSEISGVDGTGTANYIPIWNDADTIGNSIIYQDSSNIGIGTTTPGEKLEVVGNVEAEEFIGDLRGAVLFKAQAGEALTKGEVVYISGISGNTTVVSKADANDSTKMPAFGLSAETVALNAAVDIYTFGTLSNLDTSAYSEGDELFVSTTAGALTDTAPTGESSLIQKIAKVTRSHATAGSVKIIGAGRTNATPNLDTGKIFAGNSSNQAVTTDTIYVDIANSKVGIGTTSPAAKFNVQGSGTIGWGNLGNSFILAGSTSSGIGIDSNEIASRGDNLYFGTIENHSIIIRTNGANERMRITNTGNVGIGTTSPSYKLDVNGTTSNTNVRVKTTTGNANYRLQTDNSHYVITGVGSNNQLTIYDSNAAAVRFLLESDGQIRFNTYGSGTFTGTATYRLAVDTSGNVIEIPIGSGAVDGSGTANTVTMWSDADTLTDAPITISGNNATFAGNVELGTNTLNFADNGKARFGNSTDLQLYHDGSNSYISQTGTGDLYIQQNVDDSDIVFQSDDGAGGVTEYFRLDGSAAITVVSKEFRFGDNVPIKLGTAPDFQMLHNGSNTSFENSTGNLLITNFADDSDIILKSDNGSGGVTEYITIDGTNVRIKFSKNTIHTDSIRANFGNSSDLAIYHDGSNSYLSNSTNNLYIQQLSDDSDIIFQCDDGAGGLTDYFRLDGGAVETTFSKDLRIIDNEKLIIGTSNDLELFHNGANTIFNGYNGNISFTNYADDKDIIFQSDDGSGGVTEYFRLDGSHTETKFSQNTKHLDNVKATFGDTADLQIFHDGSNSYISDTNVGDLIITGTNVRINDTVTGNGFLLGETTAGVTLYYAGATKFQTKTDGVEVTGRTLISQSADSQGIQINGYDDQSASFAKMYVNSAGHTKIEQSTSGSSGYLQIQAENYLQLIAGTLIYTDDIIRIYDAGSLQFGSSGDYKLYYDSTGDVFNILTNDNYGIVIGNAGAIKFNTYGSGTNTGTATYNLAVDTNGNIIEVAASSGGIDGSGTANTVTMWSDADTLTDAPITISGNNATFAGQVTATDIYGETFRSARTDGDIYIQATSSTDFVSIGTQSAQNLLRVQGDGKVGIGTTSPATIFHISDATTPEIRIQDTTNNRYLSLYQNNSNSYIQTSLNSPLVFSTHGSNERMRITTAGNIGIGTTSPAFKTTIYSSGSTDSFPLVVGQPNSANEFVGIGLSGFVASNGAVKAGLVLDRKNIYGVGDIHILNNTTTDNSNATLADSRLTILQDGNVGIGTTSPDIFNSNARNLVVNSSGNTGISIATTDTTANSSLIFADGTGGTAGYRGAIRYKHNGDYMQFDTSASERMRITSAGNVNIGTTNASTVGGTAIMTIDVGAFTTTPVSIVNGTTDGMYIRRYSTGGSYQLQTTVGSGNSGNLSLQSYGGNVGIGTTSPTHNLQVVSAGNAEIQTQRTSGAGLLIQSQSAVGVVGTNTNHRLDLKSNSTTRMTIATSGRVGIGTTNPGVDLDVAGDIGLTGDLNMESAGDILLSPDSQLQIDGDAGTNGQVLTSTGTALEWQTPSGGSGSDTFVTNLAANHGSNSTSYYYVFRNKSNSSMIQRAVTWTSWSPVYYADLIMPSSCYLKKVILRNRTGTVTATKAKMRIFKNTSTQVYDGAFVNATGSGSTTQIVFSLSSTDAAFSEGDAVQIGFNFDGVMAGMTAVAVFQLT